MGNKKNEQPQLMQVLGLGTAILLVAGNMIGSGVFKKISPMAASLHDDKLILWAWIGAGIISMLGALSFASLASITKEAGGQFQYFKNAYGDFWGFLFGWSFFTVISTASIASISYVFAESFASFFKIPHYFSNIPTNGIYILFDNLTIKLIAIITLILLTLYNIRGVKAGGWMNNIVTGAKILGILSIIFIGLNYSGVGSMAPSNGNSISDTSPMDIFRISAFFTAMLGAFWAYDGWVNITNMASEFKNPTKTVPKAIIIGTALVMILYFFVNYAYLNVMTPDQFADISTQKGSIAAVEVASVALGYTGMVLISALIMVSTFGATQGSTMSAARVYYQMAREGYFFKSFGKVHQKFRTPYFSLTGQMIWASLLIMSGTFDQLTDMLIFAAFIFYGLGAVAVIKLKIQKRIKITYGYPYVQLLFLIFCIIIVFNAIYSRPMESLIGLGLILTGIPFFYYFRKRSGLNKKN
ncbi:MAG: amino acid permease [Saprospiraceae bacterium]